MRSLCAGLAFVLGVTACSTSSGPTTETTITMTAAVEPQMSWVLGLMVGGPLDETDFASRTTPRFSSFVPFAEFEASIHLLRQAATDWALAAVEESADWGAVVRVESAAAESEIRVRLGVEEAEPRRIETLSIQPAERFRFGNPPDSLDEVVRALLDLGDAGFLAAEVSEGTCVPRLERSADVQAPVGAVFRLYVLGALAHAVLEGTIAWDEAVPTSAGPEPVDELAWRMMVQADAVAADDLIEFLGRETVETSQALLGHADPNRPFLTTREFLLLRLEAGSELQRRYAEGDEGIRRQILAGLAGVPRPTQESPGGRELVRTIGWSASPGDLCRLLVEMHRLAGEPGLEPLGALLRGDPIIPDPGDRFADEVFAIGIEPGFLGFAWMVEERDGGSFVIAGSLFNDRFVLPTDRAIALFGSTRDLLADE